MIESFFGKIRNAVSGPRHSYFEEKAGNVDFDQINALEPELQVMLLDGAPEEVKTALRRIRRREQQTKTVLLGLAAMELIKDERARRGNNTPQPKKTLST